VNPKSTSNQSSKPCTVLQYPSKKVGHQTRLCFWNKCQMTDLVLTQLASYRHMLAREFRYPHWSKNILFIIQNFLVLIVDSLEVYYAFNCSAPAAWIQGASFGVCFKCVASFCHPQYLSKTSSLSIHSAWNSRIWHFYLNNTLLPRRNLWNLVVATLRPKSMKLTCQFCRFLARTFRPVGDLPRDPLGILKKGKYRMLYFPSGRSSFESLTKIKVLYNLGKSRSRDHWCQFSKKQLLYIDKSWSRMGLRVWESQFKLSENWSCYRRK